jgi:hypothetical protein
MFALAPIKIREQGLAPTKAGEQGLAPKNRLAGGGPKTIHFMKAR